VKKKRKLSIFLFLCIIGGYISPFLLKRDKIMYLIVGLGNPGTEYRFHRHNVGFLMLDILHQAYGIGDFQKNKWHGLMAEGSINGHKVLFLKPQTYMNLSGPAVSGPANFYKISPDKIIVIHDELDIPPGDIRVKKGGGNGGHNGLKSIDAHLGKDYWRLRIGIGHPGVKDMVSGYVLNNLPQKELPLFDELFFQIRENIHLLLGSSTITPQPFVQHITHHEKKE
jgi:peptidyl-tRNA hydrolase, PTH1 family